MEAPQDRQGEKRKRTDQDPHEEHANREALVDASSRDGDGSPRARKRTRDEQQPQDHLSERETGASPSGGGGGSGHGDAPALVSTERPRPAPTPVGEEQGCSFTTYGYGRAQPDFGVSSSGSCHHAERPTSALVSMERSRPMPTPTSVPYTGEEQGFTKGYDYAQPYFGVSPSSSRHHAECTPSALVITERPRPMPIPYSSISSSGGGYHSGLPPTPALVSTERPRPTPMPTPMPMPYPGEEHGFSVTTNGYGYAQPYFGIRSGSLVYHRPFQRELAHAGQLQLQGYDARARPLPAEQDMASGYRGHVASYFGYKSTSVEGTKREDEEVKEEKGAAIEEHLPLHNATSEESINDAHKSSRPVKRKKPIRSDKGKQKRLIQRKMNIKEVEGNPTPLLPHVASVDNRNAKAFDFKIMGWLHPAHDESRPPRVHECTYARGDSLMAVALANGWVPTDCISLMKLARKCRRIVLWDLDNQKATFTFLGPNRLDPRTFVILVGNDTLDNLVWAHRFYSFFPSQRLCLLSVGMGLDAADVVIEYLISRISAEIPPSSTSLYHVVSNDSDLNVITKFFVKRRPDFHLYCPRLDNPQPNGFLQVLSRLCQISPYPVLLASKDDERSSSSSNIDVVSVPENTYAEGTESITAHLGPSTKAQADVSSSGDTPITDISTESHTTTRTSSDTSSHDTSHLFMQSPPTC